MLQIPNFPEAKTDALPSVTSTSVFPIIGSETVAVDPTGMVTLYVKTVVLAVVLQPEAATASFFGVSKQAVPAPGLEYRVHHRSQNIIYNGWMDARSEPKSSVSTLMLHSAFPTQSLAILAATPGALQEPAVQPVEQEPCMAWER